MTTDTQAVLGGCGFTEMADGRWQAVGRHRRVEAMATGDGGLEVAGWATAGGSPTWRNRLAPGFSVGMLRVLLATGAHWLEEAPPVAEPAAAFGGRPRHARLWSALARCDSLMAADHAT